MTAPRRTPRTAIAYQGVPGAFSELAAVAFAGPGDETLPCASFVELFDAVAAGAARAGAVPVENTLAGAVAPCWDLLAERDVRVTAETIVPVSHALVGIPGAVLAGVRRVLSHPVALQQCERFFREHPAIEAVPVFDTAGAVLQVLQTGDPAQAALAAERAAGMHGGAVLARALEDHPDNLTRFFRIESAGRGDAGGDGETGGKVALAFRARNVPGALWRSLRPFAERGLQLARIESRPLRHTPFEYLFFLEAVAGAESPALAAAVEELRRDAVTLKILGRFEPAPAPRRAGTTRDESRPQG